MHVSASRDSRWLLILVPLLFMLLAGCLVKKDSPAPGCIEYWGPAPMGGCFGKTAILDLQVEPENKCLEITVNNCNGGVLEISNACREIFVLSSVTVHPSERHVSLDLDKQDGEYVLTPTEGNFSDYVPLEDESVEIWGMLGGQEVKISFVKTRELC
jgi:hypothetical protein